MKHVMRLAALLGMIAIFLVGMTAMVLSMAIYRSQPPLTGCELVNQVYYCPSPSPTPAR